MRHQQSSCRTNSNVLSILNSLTINRKILAHLARVALLTHVFCLQQAEFTGTSPNSSSGSLNNPADALPGVTSVCCNALYGSPDQPIALAGIDMPQNVIPMIDPSQLQLEDVKENLMPVSTITTACLWPQLVQAAQPPAAEGNLNTKLASNQTAQQCPLPGQQVRAPCNSPAPLQPLQADHTWQSMLLPVPSSSAVTNQMLSHHSDHMLSHRGNESANQPAADLCLFGSPPRRNNNSQYTSWQTPAVSMVLQHSSQTHAAAHATDRQIPESHQGSPHAAAFEISEAARGLSGMHVASEEDFRLLLGSAQQQRVCYATPCPVPCRSWHYLVKLLNIEILCNSRMHQLFLTCHCYVDFTVCTMILAAACMHMNACTYGLHSSNTIAP